mmetsp:Transcript_9838/g.26120  ORF Transcript_9838/g.26120 Transcript_9838/m.26120 type:complete len:139 (+) Transcript_9838:41-457(+)
MPSSMPSSESSDDETERGMLRVMLDRGVPLDIDLSECRYVADMRTAIAAVMNVHRVCVRLTPPGRQRCLGDDVPATSLFKRSVNVVLGRPQPGVYVMDSLHSCIIMWELRPYLGTVVAGCDGVWKRPKSMFVDEAGAF